MDFKNLKFNFNDASTMGVSNGLVEMVGDLGGVVQLQFEGVHPVVYTGEYNGSLFGTGMKAKYVGYEMELLSDFEVAVELVKLEGADKICVFETVDGGSFNLYKDKAELVLEGRVMEMPLEGYALEDAKAVKLVRKEGVISVEGLGEAAAHAKYEMSNSMVISALLGGETLAEGVVIKSIEISE